MKQRMKRSRLHERLELLQQRTTAALAESAACCAAPPCDDDSDDGCALLALTDSDSDSDSDADADLCAAACMPCSGSSTDFRAFWGMATHPADPAGSGLAAIFVGMCEKSPSWRFLIPSTNKVVSSDSAEFFEDRPGIQVGTTEPLQSVHCLQLRLAGRIGP